jgi:hypothetical protein
LNYRKTIVIIGGGAAGFFAAIHAAEKQPSAQILIFEKNRQVLGKVKVSGGGRCNITHACFDPYELIHHYPRGGKELLGAFTRFGVTDTINWFRQKGVYLKTEHDGRMFPVTDSAQTVIDCFLRYAKKYGIKIFKEEAVISLKLVENHWHVKTSKGNIIIADSVLATSGSSNAMWNVLRDLGHTIVPPVPSLFTFDVSDWRIKNLQGIAVPDAIVQIKQIPYQQQGPLLITHWGFSGPAILKLSAFAARDLHRMNYVFDLVINWNAGFSTQQATAYFLKYKQQLPGQKVTKHQFPGIPSRLWQRLAYAALNETKKADTINWGDLSSAQLQALVNQTTNCPFHVIGKSTYKEEFVTAGGLSLNEINFKTMESRLLPGLYFAGEVLDIDAVTGGFNFQAAWTTAWHAAEGMTTR